MKAEEIPGPPRSAGIWGRLVLASSAPPSGSIPSMAETAPAGAGLTLASPELGDGRFCAGGFCPAERTCNAVTKHPRINRRRIPITTTKEPPPYRQFADGCFALDSCL